MLYPFRTIFGWGNNGNPLPLTEEELESLSDAAKDWKKYIEAEG
jgi:hypothetical protein